jgi:hypothetical protein
MGPRDSKGLDGFMTQRLSAEERVIWRGAPERSTFVDYCSPGVVFGGVLIVFGVLVTLQTSGIWHVSPAPVGKPVWYVVLMEILQMAIGAVMIWWSIHRMRSESRNWIYALTPQRAIVIEEATMFTTRVIHSYPADKLDAMMRWERSDGSGDLVFEEVMVTSPANQKKCRVKRGFIGVKEVRRVEELVRSTLRT